VLQPGHNAGLAEIGFGILRLRNQPAVRRFHGHVAAELIIVGQVDLAKTAYSQQPDDAIAADSRWVGLWLPCGGLRLALMR
jgi:hypothetical protein